MKKILVVAGARPNFMKIAPLIREINKNKLDLTLVHTGQHYDKQMSDVFFEDLEIPKPNFNLNVGSSSHAIQTAKIMVEFEKVCKTVAPDLLIVPGDINSTMACTLVAKKMNIKVAHIEAGLRSGDLEMPEEINRIVTDSISDYFFVTEESGIRNLLNEGHSNDNIFFVGNLMIDSLYFSLKKICQKNDQKFDYGLITLHRPSNVDDINQLNPILEALTKISEHIRLKFVIHPRTKKILSENNIKFGSSIETLESLSYLDFLELMKNAKVVFTDSGGIQEETTVLGIPCYTIRNNTERPITIEQGSNRLVGTNKSNIINSFVKHRFDLRKNYAVPKFWDGLSSKRIVDIIIKKIL